MTKRVLTVDEVAKELRLSRNATYEAIARKEIPSVRVGRRILVPIEALDRLLHVAANEAVERAR
jgi:excisionase family DNA binding protein